MRAAEQANEKVALGGGERLQVAFKYTKEIPMFLTLFAVLLVMWVLGFFAFHVAGGLIHLLLIFAAISLVVHFFRRPSAV
jgi:hypothetical protein